MHFYLVSLPAPTDEPEGYEHEDESYAHEQQMTTRISDVGMLYCSDFTIHLTLKVAGGKNLIISEDKMELEILEDIIGSMVHTFYTEQYVLI